MTVKQLIDKLQRNFAPEQEVFLANPPEISYVSARPLQSVTEDSVGRAKNSGGCFIGGLGPDACVLWGKS
jgi:hypothetical protein